MNKGMEVSIAGVTLKNPVTTASGTFGSGREYSKFIVYTRRFIRYNLMASGKSAPCQ